MAHEISMGDDGVLRMDLIGDMDREGMEAYINDLAPFLEAATEAEPLLILTDSSRSGKLSSGARKLSVETNRDPRMGKTAVIGESRRYFRVMASFILKATGRDNIRFFDSEEEALTWLKSES
jgi:hypothetical protein